MSTAFSRSGSGLLAFTPFEGEVPLTASQAAPRVAAIDQAGRLPRAASPLPWPHAVLSRHASSARRALVLALSPKTTDALELAEVTPSGRLHRRQRVEALGRTPYSGLVCDASSGDAIVVWSERTGKGSTRLAMARRPARGPISRRIQLTTTTPWAYDCAIGPGGRWALVAAVRPTSGNTSVPRLQYWTGFTSRGLRRGLDLGTAPYETTVQVAIDGAGRSFVAWRNKIPGTDFDSNDYTPFKLRATSVAADGRTVTPTQVVETGTGGGGFARLAASPVAGAAMTVSPDEGDDDSDPPPGRTRLTAAGDDGVFGPLTPPIPGSGYSGPILFGPDGTPIATWDDEQRDEYLAAPFPGGVSGPVERTGLSDRGSLVATTAPSGEPRLLTIRTTKSSATVTSATRRSR